MVGPIQVPQEMLKICFFFPQSSLLCATGACPHLRHVHPIKWPYFGGEGLLVSFLVIILSISFFLSLIMEKKMLD